MQMWCYGILHNNLFYEILFYSVLTHKTPPNLAFVLVNLTVAILSDFQATSPKWHK